MHETYCPDCVSRCTKVIISHLHERSRPAPSSAAQDSPCLHQRMYKRIRRQSSPAVDQSATKSNGMPRLVCELPFPPFSQQRVAVGNVYRRLGNAKQNCQAPCTLGSPTALTSPHTQSLRRHWSIRRSDRFHPLVFLCSSLMLLGFAILFYFAPESLAVLLIYANWMVSIVMDCWVWVLDCIE